MTMRSDLPLAWIVCAALAACGGGGGEPVAPIGAPDVVAPTVALLTPAHLANGLTGILTASADASDDRAVNSVEFQLDGVPIGTTTALPWRVTLDSNAHASGQHLLRVRATDAAGNTSAWASATLQFGGSRGQPAGVQRNQTWVSGLNGATALAQSPDGRLFVAEQSGALRVVKNGALLPTPFMQLLVDGSGERGLIGVAVHPDFARNRWLYLHHTTREGGTHNRISRVTADPGNPDQALPGSLVALFDLPALTSATNHNGGALHFGADGKLYVGVGDNANSALAQDPTHPFGKLLRLNDDGSIPADNPFAASQAGLGRAVWALGLRNPYTFAVQPGTGRLHINDVGQSAWEEVNLGRAGANYGWPFSEGPDGLGAGFVGPLFAYGRNAAVPPGSGPGGFFTGVAIAGGAFYPADGPLGAPWRGNYFFADFGSKLIGLLDAGNANAVYTFGSVSGNPVDLLAVADGALLVLTRNAIVRFSSP